MTKPAAAFPPRWASDYIIHQLQEAICEPSAERFDAAWAAVLSGDDDPYGESAKAGLQGLIDEINAGQISMQLWSELIAGAVETTNLRGHEATGLYLLSQQAARAANSMRN